MLTQEELKRRFHYDPETGLFTRLISGKGRGNYKGAIAGTLNKKGYIEISINYKVYKAHRLAFLYMEGYFPDYHIDHEDTIKNHNWYSNLREATISQNAQNIIKARSDNLSTGVLGVYPNGRNFYARIKLHQKVYHLGTFKTKEQAYNAYVNAKRKLHEFGTL